MFVLLLLIICAAFAQGGLLLSSICLLFVSMQSMMTGCFVVEACARAEAWTVSVTESKHKAMQEIPLEVTLVDDSGRDDTSQNASNAVPAASTAIIPTSGWSR